MMRDFELTSQRANNFPKDSRDVTDAQSSLLSAQDAYDRAKANLQVQILTFLRQIGTLRVDPAVGTLGKAMDREGAPPVDPLGNPVPIDEHLKEPATRTVPVGHVSSGPAGKPAG